MDVVVTAQTLGVEPEIGPIEFLAASTQPTSAPDVLASMALPAIERRVRFFEPVARLGVIESARSVFAPPHQLEFLAVVLDVALATVAVAGPGMKPLPAGHTLREGLMTGETAVRGNPMLSVVAFETVAAAVEMGVRRAELAGRDLGRGKRAPRKGHRHRDREAREVAAVCQRAGPHPYPVMITTETWTTRKRYITMANGL
jgi:hypothetical protein